MARPRSIKQSPLPIRLRNQQRGIRFNLRQLQVFAEIACALAWNLKRSGAEIEKVSEVAVLITSDTHIASLHKKFSGVATSTDVLTFSHGDVVINAQAARRQARSFQNRFSQELRLYLVHGLLHLCGFDDVTLGDRRKLERVQGKVLQRALLLERQRFEHGSERVTIANDRAASGRWGRDRHGGVRNARHRAAGKDKRRSRASVERGRAQRSS